MEPAWSTRIGWLDLPIHVRTAVEDILGSEVVQFVGQRGGFSPGTADRVLTSSGKRAFVKAVSRELNEDTPKIHRQEAHIAGNLPATLPIAPLMGHYDDGHWVVLVLTDIEGQPPQLPWKLDEITLVIDALEKLAHVQIPHPLLELPTLKEELAEAFAGWKRVRELLPEACDPWIVERLDELESLAATGIEELDGRCLVHNDVRADNILITAQDQAILVDWP
ncbi:phosphotransferase [Arthrobacter sp. MYb227]|uniref:phosphotransferase n=1 Tax=Arthrobacter sp. MYb227 TaxID=1848601 RepID=UPI0015E29372|nr:phosphotransferase [Arthrobacter sp. MYb227]